MKLVKRIRDALSENDKQFLFDYFKLNDLLLGKKSKDTEHNVTYLELVTIAHSYCVTLNTKPEAVQTYTAFLAYELDIKEFLKANFKDEDYIAFIPLYGSNQYKKSAVYFKHNSDAVLFKLAKG